MGLPRSPRRVRDRQGAQDHQQEAGARDGNRELQPGVQKHRHEVLRRVVDRCQPLRQMGGLQERLQDHGPALHGVSVARLQGAL